MPPDAKINFNQLSVSAHSFRAISNFECISARLCGYWASVILAKTLDEDFLIWKTVLESILYSEQSLAILTANFSLYSKRRFLFAISVIYVLSYQINAKHWMKSSQRDVWNPQLVAVWNLANGEHGINANCIGWNQDRSRRNAASRLMPFADKPQFHTIRLANWCHTKPFGLGFQRTCSKRNLLKKTEKIKQGTNLALSFFQS